MNQQIVVDDARKLCAAQNVRDGLITVADLSALTGLEVPQLTKFAKTGLITHYGEYHGKRFFNFEELVVWAMAPGESDIAKAALRSAIENQLTLPNCPFDLERDSNPDVPVKLVWRVVADTPIAA
jgi:hypothetical protein